MTTSAPRPSAATWLADQLRELQTAEAPLVDLLSAVSPYLAPAFPAIYTWHSVTYVLLASWEPSIAWWVGLATAIGVEFIGVSAVQTAIKLWDEKRWGLLVLAVLSGLYYVAVVVISNALLGLYPAENGAHVAVSTLLASQTVVGGAIAGVRAQATKQVQAAQTVKSEAEAQADKKAAEREKATDTAFQQGMARMAQQNKHELDQLALKGSQDLALAQERTRQLELENEKILAGLSRENRDNSQENYQESFSSVPPERQQWVKDYVEKSGVSQATAYRKYTENYPKKGAKAQ